MKFIHKYKKDVIIFLIPLIIFVVLFLAYHPGIMTNDGNYQWNQVQNLTITDDHPFFSTYFIYLCTRLWNRPEVVLFFQMFLFSFSWCVMCKRLRNENNFGRQVSFTCFISLVPIISIYSITLWKDVLYSYYLMILAFLTYDVGAKKNYCASYGDFALMGVLLFLIVSYRHNGILVAMMYILTFVFLYLKKVKKNRKRVFITLLVFVVLMGIISIPKKYYLSKTQKVEASEKDESFEIVDRYITWIFGRYVKYDKISDNDLYFIDSVFDVNEWKEAYSGFIINSTITSEYLDVSYINSNKDKYHQLFIDYVLKYPEVLAAHYIDSDSLLLSVNSIDYGYIYVFPFSDWDYLSFDGINSKLPFVEKVYTKIINLSFNSVFKYFYQPGLILYLSIFMVAYITRKHKEKNLYLILVPMILNTFSLIPINLAQDLRYVYINYLTLAVIGLIYCSIDKGGIFMNSVKLDDKKRSKNAFKILLIIPAFNEEKAILNTVNSIVNYNKDNNTKYDVLVVNDGSSDKTADICATNDINTVNLVHNLGIGGAVQAGYKYAFKNDYDIAIQFDGDGQHDINYVKDIINPILKGEADFVIGSRFIMKDKDNFQSTFSRRVGIKLISFFTKLVCHKKIYDTTSGFRAANRNVLVDFAANYPLEYPEPITTVELIKKGYRIDEVPVKMNERDGGVSSIRSWKNVYYMINVILSILVVGLRRYK